MRRTMTRLLITTSALVLIAVLGISCGQYDYTSPTPGIIEIRLKSKNSRTSLIPFGPSSFFQFRMKDLEVFTTAGNRLAVLSDLNAIRRSDDGELFNTLDTLARDSALVLGRTYAPPGEYGRLELVAEIPPQSFDYPLASQVVVPNVGGVVRRIQVEQPVPPLPALKKLPRTSGTLSLTVNEGRLTRLTVMIDLDSTLTRRTETFLGRLEFYVSSIQNF